MASESQIAAAVLLQKIHNAVMVESGIEEFFHTQLGELNRLAPKEKHPEAWAVISSGGAQDKPASYMKVVYDLVCKYTDNRLDIEALMTLERDIEIESGSR